MLKRITISFLYLMAGVSPLSFAQSLPEYSMRGADRANDLKFPTEVSIIAEVGEPRMALYKPDGLGPFPALALLHQCGGLVFRSGRPNASMLEWAAAPSRNSFRMPHRLRWGGMYEFREILAWQFGSLTRPAMYIHCPWT